MPIRRNEKGWLMPANSSEISDLDEAKRIFIYEPDTGKFIRKITIGMRAKAGTEPGYKSKGYTRIRFRGKTVEAHRLAWLYVYGAWPDGIMDHINGQKSDNRICNLRVTDYSGNAENQRRARSDNQLGVIGVRKRMAKFEARIQVKGNPIHLGSFTTKEAAAIAYLNAKRKMHMWCTI